MLIGLESNLRAADIPEFSLCQGRVYSVEHLEADWKAGIINVPKTTLDEANLTPQSSYKEVTDSNTVRTWAQDELSRSKTELDALATVFPLSEKLTCRIYKSLIKSMTKVIDGIYSSSYWYSTLGIIDKK